MTYGEMWLKELERCSIISLRDRQKSTDIRKKNKVKDIIVKIKEMKWRWDHELTSYTGAAWKQEAQDRRKWKMLEEGFILQRMNQPR